MAHFKTLAFVCTLFSVNSFAESLAGLMSCQRELHQSGFSRGLYFGVKRTPLYVVKGANTDHSFMIYDAHMAYRCEVPNKTMWDKMSRCRKQGALATTYNLKLKAGLQVNTVNLEMQNSAPHDLTSADTWTYYSNIPKDVTLCEVTCSESLNDEVKASVAAGINEQLRGTVTRLVESMRRESSRMRSQCDEGPGKEIGRLFSRLTGTKSKSKEECLSDADKAVSRKFAGEPTLLKVILESCGRLESLRDTANAELKAYDQYSRASGPGNSLAGISSDDAEAKARQ